MGPGCRPPQSGTMWRANEPRHLLLFEGRATRVPLILSASLTPDQTDFKREAPVRRTKRGGSGHRGDFSVSTAVRFDGRWIQMVPEPRRPGWEVSGHQNQTNNLQL